MARYRWQSVVIFGEHVHILGEHLAVILIIPQRQDAPGGIEQGCQKDDGGSNGQREQMRDEGRDEYADHHDAEWLALLVQAVEPLVYIHQTKEYGEGYGGDHHTDVVAMHSEI